MLCLPCCVAQCVGTILKDDDSSVKPMQVETKSDDKQATSNASSSSTQPAKEVKRPAKTVAVQGSSKRKQCYVGHSQSFRRDFMEIEHPLKEGLSMPCMLSAFSLYFTSACPCDSNRLRCTRT